MASKLTQARRNAGISVKDIMDDTGLSRPTIEKAEKGKEAIRYENAAKIVNAINARVGTSYTVEALGIVTTD